jgi:hypothetical protein
MLISVQPRSDISDLQRFNLLPQLRMTIKIQHKGLKAALRRATGIMATLMPATNKQWFSYTAESLVHKCHIE